MCMYFLSFLHQSLMYLMHKNTLCCRFSYMEGQGSIQLGTNDISEVVKTRLDVLQTPSGFELRFILLPDWLPIEYRKPITRESASWTEDQNQNYIP